MEHQISGCYQKIPTERKEDETNFIQDLRIDVDGERPLNLISGDRYFVAGNHDFLGSFRFTVEKKSEKRDTLELTCSQGQFDTELNQIRHIKIQVPLDKRFSDIMVQLVNSSGDTVTQIFRKKSPYFRSVTIEHSYEAAVEPLDLYDTKALDSPSQRTSPLSIHDAFAEAGIEITLKEDPIPIAHPNSRDSAWAISELNEAMKTHTLHTLQHQGSIWLLSALEYVICTVKGLMVINSDRMGCVVFQNATGWQTSEEKRLRLFIYMHELGHCFNLKHPWLAMGDSGYSTLSWMNYPWRYRLSKKVYGAEAFWRRFNFQFNDFEVLNLRHGFRSQKL